jgi:dTDP-4-dehydrorhamnose 3,5-epimerase
MQVTPTALPEVLLITPQRHGDARGWLMESWNSARYGAHGLPTDMPQCNISWSAHGVVRGLHYQQPQPQGKLVQVVHGAVFDVAVDIRRGSPDFGRWISAELSADNHRQLWVPPGFAHGFQVLSEQAMFVYHCSALYVAEHDAAIHCQHSNLGIDWPLPLAELSAKDAAAPALAEIATAALPAYPQACDVEHDQARGQHHDQTGGQHHDHARDQKHSQDDQ